MVRQVTYEHRGMVGEGPSEVQVTIIPAAAGLAPAERLALLGARLSGRKLGLGAVIAAVLAGSVSAALLTGAGGHGAAHQRGRTTASVATGAAVPFARDDGHVGVAARYAAASAPRAVGRPLPVPGTSGYFCPRPPLPAVIQIEPGVCP